MAQFSSRQADDQYEQKLFATLSGSRLLMWAHLFKSHQVIGKVETWIYGSSQWVSKLSPDTARGIIPWKFTGGFELVQLWSAR